ncbi:cshC [Symbiodinium sp. CCMP2456]|nr:cshC [Symbiodinium sp. CCMP2456]
MVVRAANGRKKPKARKAASLLKRKAAEPSGEGEQPLAAEVSAFVESLGGLGPGPGRKTIASEDLPPELQDAEILGGSSDADASISSEDEGKVPMNRKERKEAEKQARKQAEAEKKVQQAKAAAKTPAKPAAESQSASGKRDGQIFLAALPPSVDGDTLKKDFAKFGEISRFYFHKDSDGSPRGTACIFYKDPDDADKVILLDGIDYKGNAIKVKRRPPRKPGGKQVKKQQERAVNEAAPTKEPAATQTSVPFACKAPGSGILKRTKHVAKHTAAKDDEVAADEMMPEGASAPGLTPLKALRKPISWLPSLYLPDVQLKTESSPDRSSEGEESQAETRWQLKRMKASWDMGLLTDGCQCRRKGRRGLVEPVSELGHVLQVVVPPGAASKRAMDHLHPALRQRMVRTSKAMKSCTLDRGSVLLRHGEPECKEVTILRQGAVAFCYPPGHDGKEAPRSARTPRYAAAAMGASQIVTTPGELIGVYSAIFKDPEPATVRAESATCDIYRVPWAGNLMLRAGQLRGYASNVLQGAEGCPTAILPVLVLYAEDSDGRRSAHPAAALKMVLCIHDQDHLGQRRLTAECVARQSEVQCVSSTLAPAATALAAGVLANRRSSGARGTAARGVRIQAVASSRTNGLVDPRVEGPTNFEKELGSLGAKADVQAMELSKLEAEDDEEEAEEISPPEPAKRVNTREVELWPGIPDPMVDFGGLPIPQRLADAFTERGILQPSSIQELVMPKLAKGEHIILHAPTGSGKTLAYLLPILARLQPTMHVGAQAIIFVPTPELALQVTRELKWLIYVLAGGSDGTCWFNPQVPQELACSVLLSRSNLWDTIRQDSAIMVSTPGMILSEIRQLKFEGRRFKETLAYFMASNVQAIVVDEVDALTPVPRPGNNSRRFGATEQVVAYIINVVRSRYRNRPIQMIAASATANCQRVSKFLDRLNAWKWNKRRDMARRQTPELIQANATVGRVGASPGKIRGPSKSVVPMPSSISHAVAVVKGNEQGNFFSQDRFKLLVDIVKNLKEKGTVLLFVPEHVKMDAMVLILQKGGIPDVCKYRSEVGLGISTEKALDPSFQRNPRKNPNKRAPPAEQDISPLRALQQGQDFVDHLEQVERRVLVAKVQEGRGIDLPNVRYVVQLQLPKASGEYLHLAGRTGRMGATGTSITLVTEAELDNALPLIGWKIGASFDKWDVERGQIAEGVRVLIDQTQTLWKGC